MADFRTSGSLTTDKREISKSETWVDDVDWENYQNQTGIEITNNTVRLSEIDIPEDSIHHLPISEGSGLTTEDVIGDSNGEIMDMDWVSGEYYEGYKLEKQNTGSGLNVGTLGDFGSNMDSDFSILLTVEPTSITGNEQAIFGVQQSDGMIIVLSHSRKQTGDLVFFMRDYGGSSSVTEVITSSGVISENNRYRIVINKKTNDLSNSEIWVNGQNLPITIEDGSTGWNGNAGDLDEDLIFGLFNNNGSYERDYFGGIDNPIITNNSLGNDVIQGDYENQPWV